MKIVQKGKVNVLMNDVNITVINKSFNNNCIVITKESKRRGRGY